MSDHINNQNNIPSQQNQSEDLDIVDLIDNSTVYDIINGSSLEYAKVFSHNNPIKLWLKREDTLPVKSFKLRGAYNKISQLDKQDLQNGVIAVSAGNHAQGVAFTAKKLGIKATIIMPVTTPEIKINAVKALGAEVVIYGETFSDTFEKCQELQNQTNALFIPPYDDIMVIAGQGTVAKEIVQENHNLNTIVVPIGGGGLIAGVALYIKNNFPNIKIIGIEAEDSSCMLAALKAGKPVDLNHVGSFADGVAVRRAGDVTFELVKKYVDEIITVSTDEICAGIQNIYNENRVVVEPAGAIAIAGVSKLLEAKSEFVLNKNVVAITSGANMTFERLRFVAERTTLASNKESLFSIKLPEKPGALLHLVQNVVKQHSITEFNYRKQDDHEAYIFIGISSKDSNDRDNFITSLINNNYSFEDMTHNEVAVTHIRHMIGGKLKDSQNKDKEYNKKDTEEIWDLRFPERAGALEDFLLSLDTDCNISLFHYRYTGGDVARVLVGISNCDFTKIILPTNFRSKKVTDSKGISDFL